jgi:hypothetical protein
MQNMPLSMWRDECFWVTSAVRRGPGELGDIVTCGWPLTLRFDENVKVRTLVCPGRIKQSLGLILLRCRRCCVKLCV